MSKCTVFFDESGTKEIDDNTQNLYSITAVVIPTDLLEEYEGQMKKVLEVRFGTDMPELKANWMRIKAEREKHYLKKYEISEDDFKKFSESFYSELCKLSGLKILSSVINKDYLKKSYKHPFNPNALAYEFLVQRLANFATQYACDYDFIYDEFPEGKTKAGNKWQDLLSRQHRSLKKSYSEIYKHWMDRDGMNYDALPNEIVFNRSQDHLFLQIADIVGYNIKRQTELFFQGRGKEQYWGYEKIRSLVHRSPRTGEIKRYGVVIYPEKVIAK